MQPFGPFRQSFDDAFHNMLFNLNGPTHDLRSFYFIFVYNYLKWFTYEFTMIDKNLNVWGQVTRNHC